MQDRPDAPLAARSLPGPLPYAGGDADLASAALGRLVGVLSEDAIFVLASGARDVRDALDGMFSRRGYAYAAAIQGHAHTRLTSQIESWIVEMTRAMAPVWPPSSIPMMEVVREKVTLEIGARGLRSLFSSKPSDKDAARVKRYGSLAVRTLRAVLSADGALDGEERTTIAAVIAALGLPEADANALYTEGTVSLETLDVYGEMDTAVARAIVRGAWLAAAWDGIDPREEQAIRVAAQKMSVAVEEVEGARREALERVEARRKTGAAVLDGLRYVLSDRVPGLGVRLAALVGTMILPRRSRDEALAPVGQGAPVTLAKRHAGLEREDRLTTLAIAWAAALVEDPSIGRRALLRTRWERFAEDMGEDDPHPREVVETWLTEAVAGVARTLK